MAPDVGHHTMGVPYCWAPCSGVPYSGGTIQWGTMQEPPLHKMGPYGRAPCSGVPYRGPAHSRHHTIAPPYDYGVSRSRVCVCVRVVPHSMVPTVWCSNFGAPLYGAPLHGGGMGRTPVWNPTVWCPTVQCP